MKAVKLHEVRVWSAAEVAAVLKVPLRVIEAQCAAASHDRAPFSFFAGCWQGAEGWMIPARAVEAALRGASVEQHYTAKDVAALYKLSARTVLAAIKAGRLRAVRFLGELRIPASALNSMEGGAM